MSTKSPKETTGMTTSQAADYLGLSPNTVSVYVIRGLIRAKRLGPINVITKAECDRYKRERRPRGNPNLKRTQRKRAG